MLERESNREKNLEKAMKEAKIKARKEASTKAAEGIDHVSDAALKKVSSQFNSYLSGMR